MVKTNELVSFLKNSSNENFSFFQNLKIVFRPYICPFDDLLNALPEKKNVFDFGCGGGMFLKLVAKYRNPISLGGIEIDESVITTAKSLLNDCKNVTLASYDGIHIPEYISEYDYIYMIDVLHHIPKSYQIKHLETIFNLMKPGARLIIKDIDASSKFLLFNKLHDLIFAQSIGNEKKPNELLVTLNKIGYETGSIQKRRMYVYPHYTIECIKNH